MLIAQIHPFCTIRQVGDVIKISKHFLNTRLKRCCQIYLPLFSRSKLLPDRQSWSSFVFKAEILMAGHDARFFYQCLLSVKLAYLDHRIVGVWITPGIAETHLKEGTSRGFEVGT